MTDIATTTSQTTPPLAGLLADAGLDAAVILSPQGFTHTTGFRVPTQASLPWRFAAALVTPAGLEAVLAVDMESSTVARALPHVPLHVWKEFDDDAMPRLAEMISAQLGTGPLRLGLETSYVPVGAAERLKRHLPNVEWAACEKLVEQARLSKSAEERERIVELVEASDDAIAEVMSSIRVGDTEYELSHRLVSALFAHRVQEHACLIVATGERSQYPNVGPSDRRVAPGDIVRLEIFGGRDGYKAGVARTGVIGAPTTEMTDLWSYIADARATGLGMIAPGADPAAIYRAYVDALGPLAQYAISFFGHGMGLDLHELPYLSATSTDTLVEGAVIGVEPFAMIPGKFGLQVKDVVSLTATGSEILSSRLDGGQLHVIAG